MVYRKDALAVCSWYGVFWAWNNTALTGEEGVDRSELQWTINSLVGFRRAQITHWIRRYLGRDDIKAISATMIF